MYRIVGADQKEYGPVTPELIRQWIAEGRANGSTLARLEEGPWNPLSTFPEFAADLGRQPPTAPGAGYVVPTMGPRNHPLALTGLVFSCMALVPCCCFGPLFSVSGLVMCAIAISQIGREPERWTGRSLAMAGIVLSLVSFVLFMILWFMNGHVTIRQNPIRFP